MKKSLGRILCILFVLFTCAHAKNLATYTLSANKTVAYEKEAIAITFEATQQDHADNMMFLLEPQKSSDYQIILLNKKIDDTKHHASHTTFHYLLFALKAKTISVNFNFTIQTASDKAIAHSYVDDHDDSIAIQTYNTKVEIKPLKIRIKKLQKPVTLVGDFSFKQKIQKTTINQYESVNIVYTLEGKGYEDKNFKPIKKIKGVTVFSERNDIYLKPTQEGYIIKREYIYALSAKKDFTVPALHIEAFSPKSQKYYTLTTPQHHINVTKIDTSKLLDNEEYPQTKALINFDALKQFFIYLIIFITGYVSAQFQSFTFKKHTDSKELQDIKKSKTPKELLFVLVNIHKEQQFSREVEMLEDMVYNNASHNFNTLKNRIIKGLK